MKKLLVAIGVSLMMVSSSFAQTAAPEPAGNSAVAPARAHHHGHHKHHHRHHRHHRHGHHHKHHHHGHHHHRHHHHKHH